MNLASWFQCRRYDSDQGQEDCISEDAVQPKEELRRKAGQSRLDLFMPVSFIILTLEERRSRDQEVVPEAAKRHKDFVEICFALLI